MGKAGKKFEYNGIEYDSPEETYFAMWLEEAKNAGFVKKWLRNEQSFVLCDSLYNTYIPTKGKKEKTQTILQDLKYTTDFIVDWTKDAWGVLFNKFGEKIVLPFIADEKLRSLVEIKGMWDMNNMTRLFRDHRKFLYQTQKIYINLIIPEKLFQKTYTPHQFTVTKTGKERKIKWKNNSIQNFLQQNSGTKITGLII